MNERLERGFTIGWIYVIQAGGGGSIKIGWALDPNLRLKSLQTGHPSRLRLLGVIPGTRKDEKALQKRFDHARINGEWFRRNQVLNDLMTLVLNEGFLAVSSNVSRNSPERKRISDFSLIVPEV